MSAFEVLQRKGTLTLLGFTGALLVFVVLHLVRIPLVLLAAILAGVMARLDRTVTRLATEPPRGPINQFFPPNQHIQRETVHA